MSDQDIITAAVAAHQAGHPITDGQARVIAAAWHSPSNGLARLSTSGGITEGTMLGVIAEHGEHKDDEYGAELEALLAYVERAGARGPIDSWSQLWG